MSALLGIVLTSKLCFHERTAWYSAISGLCFRERTAWYSADLWTLLS